MFFCLDIGNSHICGGVFLDDKLLLQFRYPSEEKHTSDQLGVFFKNVLEQNGIDSKKITRIGYCSVVPSVEYSARAAFIKYFEIEPFVLTDNFSGNIRFHKDINSCQVGADRLANLIAVQHMVRNKDCIIVDFGTATTVDVLTKNAE